MLIIKRLKYIFEITYHYVLYVFYKCRYKLFTRIYWHKNKNNFKDFKEAAVNLWTSGEESKYTVPIYHQRGIMIDLESNNFKRVKQKNDRLTLIIKKIRNLIQSKYRYLKYEKNK